MTYHVGSEFHKYFVADRNNVSNGLMYCCLENSHYIFFLIHRSNLSMNSSGEQDKLKVNDWNCIHNSNAIIALPI